MNIYFIYSIISRLDERNIGIKLDDITNYIMPYLIHLNGENSTNSNSNYYVNLDLLINNINLFIEKGYLIFINNKYFINKNSNKYKEYIKENTIFNNNLGSFNNLLSNLNNISFNDSNEINLTTEDMSSEDITSQDMTSEKESYDDDFTNCFIVNSLTSKQDYHLVNFNLTICSCKSYEFCKKDIKTCKHLDHLKTIDNAELKNIYPTYDVKNKICSCIDSYSFKKCDHITYLKEYGY